MKLLLDENLSPRLVARLQAEYPGTTHVDACGLGGAADETIWLYAQAHGFMLISKDNDLRQLAFLRGAPPKVVWLSVGNGGTAVIEALLKSQQARLRDFYAHPEEALLVLTAPVE